MTNKLIGTVLCVLLLITTLAVVVYYLNFRPHASIDPITISYSFEIKNSLGSVIPEAKIVVMGPTANTETRNCTLIEANYPFLQKRDHAGHGVLEFGWKDFPPFASKIVTIIWRLDNFSQPAKTSHYDSRIYLTAEKFIESDHPELQKLAQALKGNTVQLTASNFHHWVADNLQYQGHTRRNRGALYALRYREGDCTEYSTLFAALCRAVGIPARCLSGFVCDRNMVLDSADYHNWAEFYMEGKWHLSDPQRRKFMQGHASYIAFQIVDSTYSFGEALVNVIEGGGLIIH
jgi:transglutaminase-like putative cysteine protease